MRIIRDNDWGGLAMIPLLHDWGITRCNVEGCTNKPNTIIGNMGDNIPVFGLCEDHFQQCNVEGGSHLTLDFTPFDAFVSDQL
jgi:hypothetical protein